jgi:hypothetical protein
MEDSNAHFHKWKEIWIYKKSLNWLPFPRRKQQRKKVILIMMKGGNERAKKIGQMVKYYI